MAPADLSGIPVQWRGLISLLQSRQHTMQRAYWWVERQADLSWSEMIDWLNQPVVGVQNGQLKSLCTFLCLPQPIGQRLLSLMWTSLSRLPPLSTHTLLTRLLACFPDSTQWLHYIASAMLNDMQALWPNQLPVRPQAAFRMNISTSLKNICESLALRDVIPASEPVTNFEQVNMDGGAVEAQSNVSQIQVLEEDNSQSGQRKRLKTGHSFTGSQSENSTVDQGYSQSIFRTLSKQSNGAMSLNDGEAQQGEAHTHTADRRKSTTTVASQGESVSLPPSVNAAALRAYTALAEKGGEGFDGSVLVGATLEQTEAIHAILRWPCHDESAVCTVLNSLLGPNSSLSLRASTALVSATLLPRIKALSQGPSRMLFGTMQSIVTHYHKPMAEGLFLPLFVTPGALGAPQTDAMGRLIKTAWPKDRLGALFEEVCCTAKAKSVSLLDEHVTLLHLMLISRPHLTDQSLLDCLELLLREAHSLARSVKTGNLIYSLIGQYGPQVAQARDKLNALLASHETFFKKTSLAALEKLP